MKVILKQTIEGVGEEGAIVTVNDGYARNFLFPQNLGIQATAGQMKVYAEEKKQRETRKTKEKRLAEKIAQELEKVSCTVAVKTGEEDKVFGSVNALKIAELLNEQGFKVDKKMVILEEPIKALGVYTIPVKLHQDVEANVKIWVVKE
jgi:large subunit ribosomal protein L9